MFLIAGLGNPGSKYKLTRHNIGFMVIDSLINHFHGTVKKEHKAETAKVLVGSTRILLAKPQTFMNLSGESIQSLTSYYDIPSDKILIIQDDIDQDFGRVRFHKKRGHGGHNGIRDIHQKLGHNDYARLKLGVGRPQNPKQDVADYVLQNFNSQELDEITHFLEKSCDACLTFIEKGYVTASNQFNKKENS